MLKLKLLNKEKNTEKILEKYLDNRERKINEEKKKESKENRPYYEIFEKK